MTEKEAIAQLHDILYGDHAPDIYDPEDEHKAADDLLVQFLREAGFTELANEFQKARRRFWYA